MRRLHCTALRAKRMTADGGWSDNLGGEYIVIWLESVPPLDEIGLHNLSKSVGGDASPCPLRFRHPCDSDSSKVRYISSDE